MMTNKKTQTNITKLPYLIGRTSDGRIAIYNTSSNETVVIDDKMFGYHNQED